MLLWLSVTNVKIGGILYQVYEITGLSCILYAKYMEYLNIPFKYKVLSHKHWYHSETNYLNNILFNRVKKVACHPQKHQLPPQMENFFKYNTWRKALIESKTWSFRYLLHKPPHKLMATTSSQAQVFSKFTHSAPNIANKFPIISEVHVIISEKSTESP